MDQTTPLPQAATERAENRWFGRPRWGIAAFLVFALLVVLASSINTPQARFFAAERFQTFVTIFLSLFIEAAPFLIAGSIVSGFIAVYVNEGMVERYIPNHPLLAALAGSGLGFIFPVCECGVVPVTRRLYGKGLPLPVGIAFLLAAPVINPVVIFSTYAAFGWGPVLWGRVVFSMLVAFSVGLIFHLARPREILLPETLAVSSGRDASGDHDHSHNHSHHHGGSRPGIWQALIMAGDDFLDMGRYLIAGAMLAAAMQTIVPQSTLLTIGQGPIFSVFVMMALAYILSVCSTVDAFIALAFSNAFTTGSLFGFLVFGPMVDIKSSLLFMGVFRRRTVLYLILLPLALVAVIGVFWNVQVGV
ncbi:MAG: permease [Caldilineaceae bacterium]|nr:permease [Caldilineaceae bacterium]MDE0340089.1 permease [Caldilineaceae bacterium]